MVVIIRSVQPPVAFGIAVGYGCVRVALVAAGSAGEADPEFGFAIAVATTKLIDRGEGWKRGIGTGQSALQGAHSYMSYSHTAPCPRTIAYRAVVKGVSISRRPESCPDLRQATLQQPPVRAVAPLLLGHRSPTSP